MSERESEATSGTRDRVARENPITETPEPEAKVAGLEAELRDKVAEAGALNDRLLRLHAEFENYKKRAARERADFVKFANEALILDLLPVLDNLERAAATANSGVDTRGVAEGLEIILRLFQTTLEKVGVRPIEALGRGFDPNLHQAVAQVDSTDGGDNVVVEEVQRGYLLEGRLLRPSMVKVSRAKVPGAGFQVPCSEEDEPETRNSDSLSNE